jgi:hypothetical protein
MGEAALQGSRRQSAIRMLQRDYATSPLIQRKSDLTAGDSQPPTQI